MTKPHLYQSDVPPKSGVDLEALCGARISKAEFVWCVDTGYLDTEMRFGLVCLECRRLYQGAAKLTYFAGVVNGEDYKQSEAA